MNHPSSSLYFGRVTHQRLLPRVHRFAYRVMMFNIFLDEIDELSRTFAPLRLEGEVTSVRHDARGPNWWPGRFTLRRSDFLPGYAGTLDQAARRAFRELTDDEATGRISMLANLRSVGWNFNPITLYFLYEDDRVVRTLAEVTNTPWNERHVYPLGPPGTMTFEKRHHVSPFLEMNAMYRLTYQEPADYFSLSMSLHDRDQRDDATLGVRRFAATMSLERRTLTTETLRRASRRYFDMALRGTLRIYLQALRLWAKGLRYVPHPTRALKGADSAPH